MDTVLKELMQHWRHFVDTDIAKAYRDEVAKFERWVREMGLSLLKRHEGSSLKI